MKSKKNKYFAAILDKVITLVNIGAYLAMILGLGYTTNLAYPNMRHEKCKEINCTATVFNIPEWLYFGLKIYVSMSWIIATVVLIRVFFNKKIINDNTMSKVITLYLIINFILALMIEHLNNWPIFG